VKKYIKQLSCEIESCDIYNAPLKRTCYFHCILDGVETGSWRIISYIKPYCFSPQA